MAVLFSTGRGILRGQTPPSLYLWTNLAGMPGGSGSVDATGSAARFAGPRGVAVDRNGNVFVTDEGNHTLRKVTAEGVVTTIAGSAGVPGSDDGIGRAARFNYPRALAADGTGNLYVADLLNHTIRKVTKEGFVITLAGAAGLAGSSDGKGGDARFNQPSGVAVDGTGNLYVADLNNHTIRKVTPEGAVTTLAGAPGVPGASDGSGGQARFGYPAGVAVDVAGTVYVAEWGNHTIRKVTAEAVVTTLAGGAGIPGDTDGTGIAARFNYPRALSVDGAGNVFVADFNSHTIRKVTAEGVVTTLTGSAGVAGSADGEGRSARFRNPAGVALDSLGNLYVGDWGNHAVRKVANERVVTTLAGSSGDSGGADGAGVAARFRTPACVAPDAWGNLYVADYNNHTVRRITPEGVVITLAGAAGSSGSVDGMGGAARFNQPSSVAVDSAGNAYVADYNNHTIRVVTPEGLVSTLAGAAGVAGSTDGEGLSARFSHPRGVAVDAAGSVFVADYDNHTIRKVTPAGVVTTQAGVAGVPGAADGGLGEARFNQPSGLAVSDAGNLFIADSGNHTIRRMTASGTVTTFAGSAGIPGGDDGEGNLARFNYPRGVAVDTAGNVYVGDYGNHLLRRVTPAGSVTTLAGGVGIEGDAEGSSSAARFRYPWGLAADRYGSLYVADSGNNRISKGTPPSVTMVFDGTALLLSWPARCLGWELQSQSSDLGSGVGSAWLPVPDSTATTRLSIPFDPGASCVIYQLRSR